MKIVDKRRLYLISLALFSLAGLISRFAYINSIPASVSHDEIIYTINAQSVAATGKGMTGEWLPLNFTPIHTDFAELPAALMAPFNWLPVPPLLASKLPYIIMSLLLPAILGMVTYRLTSSKNAALIASFMATFNPWIWQFSRMSFDAYWSIFFLMLGTLILICKKGWIQTASIPIFFLGFYQYQGHKLVFLPWILAWCLYLIFKENGKYVFNKRILNSLPVLITATAAVLIFAFYLIFQLPNQSSAQRTSAIIFPQHQVIQKSLYEQRRLSLDTPVNRFALNSYTIWAEHVVNRYAESFNPRFLFLEGQASNSAYTVWNHGIFYLIDAAMIIFGIIALSKKKNHGLAALLFALLLIAPLPAVLAEKEWYVFRASMVVPVLIVMAAIGAAELHKKLPNIYLP